MRPAVPADPAAAPAPTVPTAAADAFCRCVWPYHRLLYCILCKKQQIRHKKATSKATPEQENMQQKAAGILPAALMFSSTKQRFCDCIKAAFRSATRGGNARKTTQIQAKRMFWRAMFSYEGGAKGMLFLCAGSNNGYTYLYSLCYSFCYICPLYCAFRIKMCERPLHFALAKWMQFGYTE